MQAISTCVCLLVLSAMAFAEDEEKTGVSLSWFYAYTFGIVFISVLITLVLTGSAYLLLRYVKKREIQSEDDLEDVKVIPDESPPIEPIITVSEVVSSIKESLEHLGNTLLSSRDRLVEKDIVHF